MKEISDVIFDNYVSRGSIRKLLGEEGVKLRTRGGRNNYKPIAKEDLRTLSTKEICKKYKVCRVTVERKKKWMQ